MKRNKLIYWIITIVVSFILFCLFTSCKTNTVYIPVETVKTEYRDNYLRDSVYLYDSVFVKIKEDTVWLEKYKYLYRDKMVKDSIYINDTIRIPYPVVEYKEVNKLKDWQKLLLWIGGISIIILIIIIRIK